MKSSSNILFIWILFQFSALTLSYAEIKGINAVGVSKTDEFWPFTKFVICSPKYEEFKSVAAFKPEKSDNIKKADTSNRASEIQAARDLFGDIVSSESGKELLLPPASRQVKYVGDDCRFSGVFANYDWTEFLFYSSWGIIIYVISKISKRFR